MFLSLLIGLAGAKSYGAGFGTVALRTSSGNHRQHVGMNLWTKTCTSAQDSERENCWQYALGVGENIHLIPGGRMINTVIQPKVLYGVQMGIRPLKVGFSVGVGVNGIIGGAETLVWNLQPGLIGAIELEQPIGTEWLLRLEANQMLYAFGSNYGLVLGGAKKW